MTHTRPACYDMRTLTVCFSPNEHPQLAEMLTLADNPWGSTSRQSLPAQLSPSTVTDQHFFQPQPVLPFGFPTTYDTDCSLQSSDVPSFYQTTGLPLPPYDTAESSSQSYQIKRYVPRLKHLQTDFCLRERMKGLLICHLLSASVLRPVLQLRY